MTYETHNNFIEWRNKKNKRMSCFASFFQQNALFTSQWANAGDVTTLRLLEIIKEKVDQEKDGTATTITRIKAAFETS